MISQQPILSDQEWTLVVELLESERRALPTEIHHTDKMELVETLEERKAVVTELVERLHTMGLHS